MSTFGYSKYNGGGYDYLGSVAPIRIECRVKFDGTEYVPNRPYPDPKVKPKLAAAFERGDISHEDIIKMAGSEGLFQLRDRGVYRRAGAASATDVKIPLFEVTKGCIVGVRGYCTHDLSDVRRVLTVGVDDVSPGIDIDPTLFLLSYFPAWRVHQGEMITQLYPPLPTYPNDTIVGHAAKFFNPETELSKGTVVNLYIKNDTIPADPNVPFDPGNATGSSPITEGDITLEFFVAAVSAEQYEEYNNEYNSYDTSPKPYSAQDKTYQYDFGPVVPRF